MPFIQVASINLGIRTQSQQHLLDPRELVKDTDFEVIESSYENGILTSLIQFNLGEPNGSGGFHTL